MQAAIIIHVTFINNKSSKGNTMPMSICCIYMKDICTFTFKLKYTWYMRIRYQSYIYIRVYNAYIYLKCIWQVLLYIISVQMCNEADPLWMYVCGRSNFWTKLVGREKQINFQLKLLEMDLYLYIYTIHVTTSARV